MVYPYSGILFSHKEELSPDATIWMSLENIMLSGRSQTQKSHVLYDSIYSKYPE
jgi:hypothetical protein